MMYIHTFGGSLVVHGWTNFCFLFYVSVSISALFVLSFCHWITTNKIISSCNNDASDSASAAFFFQSTENETKGEDVAAAAASIFDLAITKKLIGTQFMPEDRSYAITLPRKS